MPQLSKPPLDYRRAQELRSLRTAGEIEAAVCDGVRRFETEYMGRGPREVRAFLIGDMILVRLSGVLTVAEQHLLESCSNSRGRELLKHTRTHLLETARPKIEAMVKATTEVCLLTLHHDISTETGEEIMVFILEEAPACREARRR